MNPGTRLRTSAAVWTAALWLGLVVFYFFYALHVNTSHAALVAGPLWAPEQISATLTYFYSLAYAITMALAVWEGGRLRRDGIWELAPARSRYRVATHALAPVIGAGWLILILPVTMRMVEIGQFPTSGALTPVLAAMAIVCAWAVIGCALAHIAPRMIAAPIGGALTFYFVARSWSYSTPVWPRHLLGQISTGLAFGDEYAISTVVLPVVFAAVGAGAIAVWWARLRSTLAVRLGSAALAVAVMAACIHTVNGWHIGDGPVSSGHAPARCAGTAPRVCMAETGGAVESLPAVRQQVVDSIKKLQSAGVKVETPRTVEDSLLRERHRPASSATQWWIPLSERVDSSNAKDMTGVRYAVLLSAVRYPCRFPSSFKVGQSTDWVVNRDAAMLWAAHVLDAEDPYLRWRKGEYLGSFSNPQQVLAAVKKRAADGGGLPTTAAQATWFGNQQARACRLLQEGSQS